MSQDGKSPLSVIVWGSELGPLDRVRHAIWRSGDGQENEDTGMGSFVPIRFFDT